MTSKLQVEIEKRNLLAALKNEPGWKILLDIYSNLCIQFDNQISLPAFTAEAHAKQEFLKGARWAFQQVLQGPDKIIDSSEFAINLLKAQERRDGHPEQDSS